MDDHRSLLKAVLLTFATRPGLLRKDPAHIVGTENIALVTRPAARLCAELFNARIVGNRIAARLDIYIR
jgi:hypothetical protein